MIVDLYYIIQFKTETFPIDMAVMKVQGSRIQSFMWTVTLSW